MQGHILIVDDEPKLAQSLAMVLEDEDYEASIAMNGIEALKRVWTAPYPDLVLLDWKMPCMSGLEVCRRLRQAAYEQPIVFVTGMVDRSYQEAGFEARAIAYLVMPLSVDEIITTVTQLLNKTYSRVSQAA